jgi:hypothetical protein
MKSRQKSDKRKQRFSEDWQSAVLKQQDTTTNSTALSPEITKSETAGPTPINKNTYFEDGEWWYYGARGGKQRQRVDSHNKKNKDRMFVNGKYVAKSHPLYKAGSYKGFEDAAFSSLENFKNTLQGQVYVITNPAWEGWVKVGMAVDAEDRAKNYQTSSPYRDYELAYVVDTSDRRATEAEAHRRLSDMFEQRNEWFKCDVEIAKRWIDSIIGEYDETC